jgi:hypothetical protein
MDRLDPGFFQLRSGLAGEMLQKFVIYRMRLAIAGDFVELALQSSALRDLIYEANRGKDEWFVSGLEELQERLAAELEGRRP